MQILVGILIYLISLSIIFLPERIAKPMAATGAVAAIVGFVAFVFLFFGPKDYLVTHPRLGRIFDPYGYALFYGFCLVCGTGMSIGFGVRKLIAHYKRLRSLQD